MNLRKLVRNFFGFSRAETNGFLILIPLVLLVLFSEPLYRNLISRRPSVSASDKLLLDSLIVNWEKQQHLTTEPLPDREIILQAFDPNKTSKEELLTLGFSASLANRIVNYRKKGGKFWVKKDLLKMYGMDSSFYTQIQPYLMLPEQILKEKKEPQYANVDKTRNATPRIFDLNVADTSQLKKIYGIGEKLSLRILKYRESLGGFIHANQLLEVYGLDSTVVNRLTRSSFIAESFEPVKLNLNTSSEEEFDKHPYLTRKEAKAIVAYRFQHGPFSTLEDLRKIQGLEKSTLEKISPYLSVAN